MALDAVLVKRARLAPCATDCRHCGIRFLTHPRNAGRRTLLCPFGCRQHLRRQCLRERSKKHYQTAEGRRKKKQLNGQRSSRVEPVEHSAVEHSAVEHSAAAMRPAPATAPLSTELHPSGPCSHPGSDPSASLCLEGVVLDEDVIARSPLLPYVGLVLSLFLRRRVRRDELLDWLRRTLRQRRLVQRRHIDYVLRVLQLHPP